MKANIEIKTIDSIKSLKDCAKVLVDAYNAEPWNDNWTNEKALEKLICFYNSPKFLGWMAFQEGKLLGCCVGNIEPYYTGDYYYLKEMFVLVQSQRSGIGSALFNAVKQHLANIDIKMIILFTSNTGFPFEFWKKSGFGEMDDMRMMYWGDENG